VTDAALPSRARGVAALVLAGFLFGSTFLVVQDAVGRAAVVPFLAARFLIGGAVLWPLARRRPSTPGVARDGIVAGLSLLVGYLLQTYGLRDTTSATSAFITYLLVVMVPLMGVVRFRRAPAPNVVAGVVLAVGGLYALSGGIDGIGRGELLTVGAAFCFALHIVILGEVAGRHDPIRLTMWQVLTVGGACLVPGAFAEGGYGFDGGVWAAAAFTGVGATALAFWCMAWAQRVVPESQAAIILLLEPVSAGVLGVVVGEELGWSGALGAVLILAAVLVAELGGRDHRPDALGGELALVPEHETEVDSEVDDGGGTDQPRRP
jgi:drug/metabolite transporter (DMT)-like permease